jgi:cyanophycinase
MIKPSTLLLIVQLIKKISLATALALLGNPAKMEAQTIIPWWPKTGTVMLGGGHLSDLTAADFEKRFVSLAGGPHAYIIIIPTANPKVSPEDLNDLKRKFESLGAGHVLVLNTRDHRIANSDSIAHILRTATGVFITGGQPMILQKAYRGTQVEIELKAVLSRGGVIAGDSAGAVAIGCMWLNWLPDPYGKRTDELCILSNVTVSPHANAAQGFVVDEEVLKYLITHPEVIGIDLDEDAMLIIDSQHAEVIGKGYVSVLDATKNKNKAMLRLKAGKQYDLQH